jgi:hypothetical protein
MTKRLSIISVVLLVICFAAQSLYAPTIRNKLNQALLLTLHEGKPVTLQAGGTIELSEQDLSSPNIKALIKRGEITLISGNPAGSDKARIVTIRNQTSLPIIINLRDGRNLSLLAHGTATISEEDASSNHFRSLVSKGVIAILPN